MDGVLGDVVGEIVGGAANAAAPFYIRIWYKVCCYYHHGNSASKGLGSGRGARSIPHRLAEQTMEALMINTRQTSSKCGIFPLGSATTTHGAGSNGRIRRLFRGAAFWAVAQALTLAQSVQSAEFDYIVNPDSITVTGYKGKETVVEVPDEIEGLPVVRIKGLSQYDYPIHTIRLGRHVSELDSPPFTHVYSLSNIWVDPLNPTFHSRDGVLFRRKGETLVKFPRRKGAARYEIPDGVTAVEESGFLHCWSVESVSMPSSLVKLGPSAFHGCGLMTNIAIVEGLAEIGFWAFNNCSSLVTISLPASVTNITGAPFLNCAALTNITVDPANPAYRDLDGVLANKAGTTLLTYPPLRRPVLYAMPPGVTSIAAQAFHGCRLTGVEFDENLRSIGRSAFASSLHLVSLVFGENLESIGDGAFAGCQRLRSVRFGDGLRSIGASAFALSPWLARVDIPDGVATLGPEAFRHCVGLTNATIGRGVASIGAKAFNNCPSLTSIKVAGENPHFSDIEGVLFNKARTTLIQYPNARPAARHTVPDSVRRIGDFAFADAVALTNVTLGAGGVDIGMSAFENCRVLAGIELGSATNISARAFADCWALSHVEVPDSVLAIGDQAFERCTGLKSARVGDGVKTIGVSAFQGCGRLVTATFGERLEWVRGSAFKGCGSLVSASFGSSLSSIDHLAFAECRSLERVFFKGNGVRIGDYFAQLNKSTLYHLPGKRGWNPVHGGRPAVEWNPGIALGDRSPPRVVDGKFAFELSGGGAGAGVPLVVEVSTDLANRVWTPIATNVLGAEGFAPFVDPSTLAAGARYYRFRAQ